MYKPKTALGGSRSVGRHGAYVIFTLNIFYL